MNSDWVAFSYTLSTKKKSSSRVAIWRRLQRLGAITPVAGVYILPAIEQCIEAFQWLAQEVRQAEGQAVVMHVDGFDGLDQATIVELFHAARREDYAALDAQAAEIETQLQADAGTETASQAQDALAKLKRRFAELSTIDYFECYERKTTAARLEKITLLLFPDTVTTPAVATVAIADYQGKTWVTRPQPHVDRLASIWLIRRFIDADATIRYATTVTADEIGFDMKDTSIGFGHTGNLCTFETLIKAFQIDAPGIATLAEIVHQIDLQDERFVHPEAIGIDAILRGWLKQDLSDAELEQRGVALFEGIYQTVKVDTSASLSTSS